jgi:hypothetical protein
MNMLFVHATKYVSKNEYQLKSKNTKNIRLYQNKICNAEFWVTVRIKLQRNTRLLTCNTSILRSLSAGWIKNNFVFIVID